MSYVIDAANDRQRICVPNFKKTAKEKAELAAAKANHRQDLRRAHGANWKKYLNPTTAPIKVRNSF